MSDDISHAFDHPEHRARATASAMPDRISLRDHIVSVEIGAFQTERGTTQRLSFNIVVEVTPFDGPVDDNVDRILSYDKVTEAIAFELAAERLNLLETLAERIAARILYQPQALRVFVRIEKLDRGPGALGVEIVRGRDAMVAREAAPPPRPLVLHIGNAAFTPSVLKHWLDQVANAAGPVILCVDLPEVIVQAGAPEAQRHIDLLAIEQNAWTLAARDSRVIVAGTRTELDWAVRQGQICVWAPSVMVLDAVGGPVGKVDATALTLWLAQQMNASAVYGVGVAPVGVMRGLPLDGQL